MNPPKITELFNQIDRGNEAFGFMKALCAVRRMDPVSGHPAESECLERIYALLEKEYAERYRRGGAA